jgi:hypothetical protein
MTFCLFLQMAFNLTNIHKINKLKKIKYYVLKRLKQII